MLVLPFRLDVQGVRGTSMGVVFSRMLRIQQRLVVVLHVAALKSLSTAVNSHHTAWGNGTKGNTGFQIYKRYTQVITTYSKKRG